MARKRKLRRKSRMKVVEVYNNFVSKNDFISDDTLKPNEGIFYTKDSIGDSHEMRETRVDSSGVNVFKTTRENKITVAEESLDKEKHLFNTRPVNNCETSCIGFQTARGNKVTVAQESLDKVKGLFNDTQVDSNCTGFIGFQTAGGNKVTGAQESLDKVKGLFNDTSPVNDIVPGIRGFSNCRGKQGNSSTRECRQSERSFQRYSN